MSDPNILLIVLDSVRATSTSLHTEDRDTTPYLSELADESTVYEQARSPSSWSLPSHVSMFTGEHAHDHELHSTLDSLPEGHTIFEELSDDGYDTGVFSENPFISTDENGLCRFDHLTGPQLMRFTEGIDVRDFTIHNGVEQYSEYIKACLEHDHPIKSIWNGIEAKLTYDFDWVPTGGPNHPPGTYYGGKFLDWVDNESNDPWAACVNLMDAHFPWKPTEYHEATPEAKKYDERLNSLSWEFYTDDQPWWVMNVLESLYHDTIRDADRAVKQIVEGLRDRGELDDTLVIVTSDHGEVFGEFSEVYTGHRMVGHNMWTHEKLLHVPLLVRTPGQSTGKRRGDLASLTNFPDVVRAARDGEYDDADFAVDEYAYASVHFTDTHNVHDMYKDRIDMEPFKQPAHAVYTQTDRGIYKTIRRGDTTKELLVHSTDVDSASEHTPIDLDVALNATSGGIRASGRDDEYDEDMMERLEDLGYA